MSIKIDTRKNNGRWQYIIYAGEDGDMEEYAYSSYVYYTETEAETNALKWIIDEWNVLD